MNKLAIRELIERYLTKRMSSSEQEAFEEKLRKNDTLVKEMDLEKEVNAVLKDKTGIALENNLKNIGQEFASRYSSQEPAKVRSLKFSRTISWLVAASILLFASFWFLKDAFLKIPTDDLYAQIYEPYIANTMVRSFDPIQENVFNEALKRYQKGAYVEAIAAFEQLEQNDQLSKDDRLVIQFYLGLSQMDSQDIDQAIPYFQQVIQDNSNLYIQQSKWYLALCYLKKEKLEQAKILLHEITTESKKGKYVHLANDLLKNL